jgi:hypothetical protein
VKIISRRKKGNSASKSQQRITRNAKKKLKIKTVTLLKKENVNTPSTQKIHAKF